MGRTGFGVRFGDAESADLAAQPTPYATMMDGLGELVDDVSVAALQVAMDQARQLRMIETAREWAVQAALGLPGDDSRHSRMELAERSFTAELAAALHISEMAARKLIWTARCLVNDLPRTLEFLTDGAISLRHAQILVDQVGVLDPESVTMLEQKVLARGITQTPPQFERSVRTMAEKLNLEDMVERQVAAAEKRTIYVEPMRDGMGRLCIEAPMVQLVAIDNRATAIAKTLQSEGELRTLTQLKVDVVTDILADADGQKSSAAGQGDGPVARFRGIRPTVLVTVPALTLLRRGPGLDANGDELPQTPGTLEGYGPIDPQTAREIAANATSMIRILTHPETGIVLSMGRRRYRIPQKLRMFLRFRDGTCRFPGCNRRAVHCEVDHTKEWATENGETAHNNLGHLCTGHHALKGNTDWNPLHDPQGSGDIMWITPTGRVLHTQPENRFEG